MLYIYPFVTFGSVSLNHYNLFAYNYKLKNQNAAYGLSLGVGYETGYLSFGITWGILYTSATSNYREGGSNAYLDYTLTHRLINYIFYIPVGLIYPLSDNFSVYVGVKPMVGFSSLRWYDSLFTFTDLGFGNITSYVVRDAGLGSSSLGMGLDFGGNFMFSQSMGLYVRFGYDILNFKNYEGEQEIRYSDGSKERYLAYLIFNTKTNELSVEKEQAGIPGEENLSGFRFSVGVRIGLGR